jgi:hypothetical protein
VWRVGVLHRSLLLVSGLEVPVDRDSLPVHLLAEEPRGQQRAVAQVLGQNLDLLPLYGSWLASAHPAISAEVVHMGKTRKKKFALDVRPLFEHLGWQEILNQVGVKSLIDQVGLDELVAQMTPEQRKELVRVLQKTSSHGD